MNLGSAIEQCRKLKGLTKTELSDRSGLSISYLTLLEQGKREAPNISVIEKIASGLGLPTSLLIFLASDDDEISSLTETTKNEIREVTKNLLLSSQGDFFT